MLKVRLPTVDSRNIGTTRRRERGMPADCADLLLGRVVQGTVADVAA